MNAFIIDDAIVEKRFSYASAYLLRFYHKGVVWINGKRSSNNGQWNVFDFNQKMCGPLFNKISWADKNAIGDYLKFLTTTTSSLSLPASCNDRHWATCEYYKNAEYRLNVTECRNKKSLHVDGKYVKSMCIIETQDTYDEARQRCARNGMNLFIIDSAGLQSVFHQSTNDFLSDFRRGHVWINGRKDKTSSQWMIYNQSWMKKLFNKTNFALHGETSGDCLRYSGYDGDYLANGHSCDSRHWIVCEYNEG